MQSAKKQLIKGKYLYAGVVKKGETQQLQNFHFHMSEARNIKECKASVQLREGERITDETCVCVCVIFAFKE